jgi:hypothetical protein
MKKLKKLIGQEALDSVTAFEKKYRDNPELVREVQNLQDLLASWYAVVLLNGIPRAIRNQNMKSMKEGKNDNE